MRDERMTTEQFIFCVQLIEKLILGLNRLNPNSLRNEKVERSETYEFNARDCEEMGIL